MKKIIFCSLLWVVCMLELSSQTLNWHVDLGNTTTESFLMLNDFAGNTYITSRMDQGPYDYNPNGSPAIYSSRVPGTDDIMLSKYDSSGVLIWNRQIGGSRSSANDPFVRAMRFDAAGNIHIGGYYFDTLFAGNNFLDTLMCRANYGENAFWAKYSPGGNLLFIKTFTDTLPCRITDLNFNPNGDAVVLLNARSDINVDLKGGTAIAPMTSGALLTSHTLCYDSGLNLKWKFGFPIYFSIGQDFEVFPESVTSVLIYGSFRDSMDIDPGPAIQMVYPLNGISGTSDDFVAKVDSGGNLKWVRIIDCDDTKFYIDKLSSGYRMWGGYVDSADFDPGPSTEYGVNGGMFIAEYDSAFNYLSHMNTKSVNSGGYIYPRTFSINAKGEPVFIGTFSTTKNFSFTDQPHMVSTNGSLDLFIARYRKDYSQVGVTVIGGAGFQRSQGGFLRPDNSVVIFGYGGGVTQTIDIEPGPDTTLFSYSSKNWWLGHYRRGPDEDTTVSVKICSFDSIFLGGAWRDTAGTYVDSMFTYLGGDSIVTTIMSIDSSSITDLYFGICPGDSIYLAGSWRDTAGVYFDSLSNSIGCDSLLQLHLSIYHVDSVDIGPDITRCDGDSIILNASHPSYSSYNWSNANTSAGYSSIYNAQTSDSLVWVNVTDTNSCQSRDTILIADNNLGPFLMFYNKDSQKDVTFRYSIYAENADIWHWNFGDGTSHQGDTLVTHSYSNSGSYIACLIVSNECDKDSVCQGVGVFIGIEENADNSIRLYPNPADQSLTLEVNDSYGEFFELIIIDLTGRIVVRKELLTNITTLDVSELTSGQYLVKIQDDNGTIVERQVVITH
ncbi:MAG: T9SS type A sorting domain-containing protein [Vicingaceae bacterium]